VLFGPAGDQDPTLEVLGPDQPGHGLEILGAADVPLREVHPAVGPLAKGVVEGFLLGRGPRDVHQHHAGHRVGVLARGAGSLPEVLQEHPDLLFGGPHGHEGVAELSGLAAEVGARGGDEDRGRGRGKRVEPRALHPEEWALMAHHLAFEESAQDPDRLQEAGNPFLGFGPVAARDVLVEGLAGAQAQPEAARVHHLHGGRRLGQHGRVIAVARCAHRRAEG